jgi:hypothetical protein
MSPQSIIPLLEPLPLDDGASPLELPLPPAPPSPVFSPFSPVWPEQPAFVKATPAAITNGITIFAARKVHVFPSSSK